MFNQEEFIAQLSELISIDCGTYTPAGVNKIANILEGYFKEIGFYTKQIKVSDKVGNLLIATNQENPTHFDAVLLGHMDTVYAEGLVAKHPMRIEGNNIFGLGSIDMKSGILTGLHTVYALDKSILDKLSICFICNPDEEISSIYSQDFMGEYIKKAKCSLVLESAGKADAIVNKRKGISRFHVSFKGKSAHGSTPKEGLSAVIEMANFILKLEEFNNEAAQTTVNVGIARGGDAGNVVPENAELDFEIRYFDMDSQKVMMDKVESFVKNPSVKGVEITLEQLSFKPPMNNGAESQWLEDLVVAAALTAGNKLNVIASGGGSDGNYSSYLGIPTIDGLGPVGGYWHNAEREVLFLDSVEPKIDTLKNVLVKLSSK
ncbi:MAG: M20/M25/M40 family metallo-hydrolase [Alphaproteobacteria bacterium]|jgi:glutamate carboxypeptidase|nr:M20/M25/M40 family metallo-hydrolase [Alphaproteobacteria bacterium]